jgi:hypothetical protein
MRISILFMVLFIASCLTYDAYAGTSTSKTPKLKDDDPTLFSRTYKHRQPDRLDHRSMMKRKINQSSSSSIIISYDELSSHLALDKVRQSVIVETSQGQPLTMDVGDIDLNGDSPQTWVMPDLIQFASSSEFVDHIDWSTTGFENGFPGQTHAFYVPSGDFYEFYELSQDELFFYGFGTKNEADEVDFEDWYLTIAPLPLEWGLDFEGTVVFIYDEDPDYDSLVLVQHYEAVADGSLLTYDEGPVDAVKLHFTETVTGYKDGAEVDFEEYREVVWYSVEGHYLRGLLAEGASFTGVTAFEDMRYQKISKSVSTDNTHVEDMGLEFFPNPVSAGDVITIAHDRDLHYGLIQLFDIQGRLVQQLDLSGLGAVRNFQVQLPSDLVAGMYMYQVQSPKGESMGQGKLNIH